MRAGKPATRATTPANDAMRRMTQLALVSQCVLRTCGAEVADATALRSKAFRFLATCNYINTRKRESPGTILPSEVVATLLRRYYELHRATVSASRMCAVALRLAQLRS